MAEIPVPDPPDTVHTTVDLLREMRDMVNAYAEAHGMRYGEAAERLIELGLSTWGPGLEWLNRPLTSEQRERNRTLARQAPESCRTPPASNRPGGTPAGGRCCWCRSSRRHCDER